jgi:hypothetical protein
MSTMASCAALMTAPLPGEGPAVTEETAGGTGIRQCRRPDHAGRARGDGTASGAAHLPGSVIMFPHFSAARPARSRGAAPMTGPGKGIGPGMGIR